MLKDYKIVRSGMVQQEWREQASKKTFNVYLFEVERKHQRE